MRLFSYLCGVNRANTIVAFTGHRAYDGSANGVLDACIAALYAEGARTFRVGMAEGFDLAAAEAVIALMSVHADIRLEAYIPWPSFYKRFSAEDQRRYLNIVSRCVLTIYIDHNYSHAIFYQRNDRLIEGADIVVAWWDGSSSGTGYTVKRARKNKLRVVNLRPDPQLLMEL